MGDETLTSTEVAIDERRLETARYLRWLETDCRYTDVRLLPDGRWAAIWGLMFTHAIVVGQVGDMIGFDDRWCYHTLAAARAALEAWDGVGEPETWHRHPASGRRRKEDGEEYFLP